MVRMCGTTRESSRRMLKKAVQQGRSSAADLRFTFHASRFTAAGSLVSPFTEFAKVIAARLPR